MAKFNFKYGDSTSNSAVSTALSTQNIGSVFQPGDFILDTASGNFYIANPEPDTSSSSNYGKIFHINSNGELVKHLRTLSGSNTYVPVRLTQGELDGTYYIESSHFFTFEDVLAYLCKASGLKITNGHSGNLYLGSIFKQYDQVQETQYIWMVVGFNMNLASYSAKTGNNYECVTAPSVTLLRIDPATTKWFDRGTMASNDSLASYGMSALRQSAARAGIKVESDLNTVRYVLPSGTETEIKLTQCRDFNYYIKSQTVPSNGYVEERYTASDVANVPNLAQMYGKTPQIYSPSSDEMFPLFKAEPHFRRYIHTLISEQSLEDGTEGYWLRDTNVGTSPSPSKPTYVNFKDEICSGISAGSSQVLITYHTVSLSGQLANPNEATTYSAFPWVADGKVEHESKILQLDVDKNNWITVFPSNH